MIESLNAKQEYGACIYEIRIPKTTAYVTVNTYFISFWGINLLKTGTTTKEVVTEWSVYYSYTEPKLGGDGTVKTSKAPNGTKAVAQIHTHWRVGQFWNGESKYGDSVNPNMFSPEDKGLAKRGKFNSYIATCTGDIHLYEYKTGKVTYNWGRIWGM